MQIEDYKKQFKPETLELIVRIDWCWEKGKAGFPMLDNYYEAKARFDKALNVKTGELLETGVVWLEWLAPKKAFGFKYGYKLKKGAMYRVLVRESIPKEKETFRAYYLEQVLEKDINEPRLDARYTFESKFEDEYTDLTVLIKSRIYAWVTEAKYRIPSATFIASIDHRTNELSRNSGTLAWIEKNGNSNIKFHFDALGTYLVRVRKSKENANSYLLADVIRKVTDDRLEAVKEQYLKPIVIENGLGEFRLDRNYSWFEGQIDYLGKTCDVYMKVGEGETAVDIQLKKLEEIVHNLADWDKQLKEYVSNELLESANEWCEDETEITREQFLQRIGIPEIIIDTDGTVEVRFDSDDMFSDHCIVVTIDKNGEFTDTDIEG